MKKRHIAFWIAFPISFVLVGAILIFLFDLTNGPLVLFILMLLSLVALAASSIILLNKKLLFRFIPWVSFVGVIVLLLSLSKPSVERRSATLFPNPEKTEVLQLVNGKVQGAYTKDKQVEVYAGIPYAKAPVGDLRWKATQPVENWDGVKDCTYFAPKSMQSYGDPITGTLVEMYAEKGWHPDYSMHPNEPVSEDSLYLNIWRPASFEGTLPILVYIHGGSLTTGSSAFQEYNGETMARNGVIMITITYRLGIFGYFAHEDLLKENDGLSTGNYGLLDQIEALRWVNANAASFGGDVDNITIAGESAGSSSVSALCSSPLAKGLFKRAIGESSSIASFRAPHTFRSLDDALATGKKIMKEFNVNSIEELRKVPATKLLTTQYSNSSMCVDGYALTKSPYEVYKAKENNEEAGEHWTPRDVVELMADLIFIPVADQIKDATYSCYDGACGTGGMLTVAQDRLLTLAARWGKKVSIHLFGQEINPETYAIAKADMLLKGDGDQAEHIGFGSTLSSDQNPSRQFDFMLSNPPYGKSWKTDAEKMGGKKEILDTRFNTYLEGGEKMAMIPRTSDGQLLFLLNNVSKMKKDTQLGSRIAEVHNGSSIFTGDAGSGESNARRYMIENDLVEAIIAVPENMFYNTGIGTFIWILSNKKEDRRKGKIQLIDATAMKSPLRRNMGKKNCEFTSEIRKEILRIFLEMEESEISRVFANEEFGYWSVTVERPLRLRVYPDREIPAETFKKADELKAVRKAIASVPKDTPLDDWTAFAKATKLKAATLKKVRPFITEKDPTAQAIDGEADTDLRDTEIVPFLYEGGIDAFMQNEVLTYAPDAWVDKKKTQIGYEISFTKYFYKPVQLREMAEIIAALDDLEKTADGMMGTVLEGLL